MISRASSDACAERRSTRSWRTASVAAPGVRARRPVSAPGPAPRGAAGRSSQPSVVDPALAARIFYGMIFNSMMGRRVFQDPVLSQTNLEETARALVRIFLDGIGRVEEGS